MHPRSDNNVIKGNNKYPPLRVSMVHLQLSEVTFKVSGISTRWQVEEAWKARCHEATRSKGFPQKFNLILTITKGSALQNQLFWISLKILGSGNHDLKRLWSLNVNFLNHHFSQYGFISQFNSTAVTWTHSVNQTLKTKLIVYEGMLYWSWY